MQLVDKRILVTGGSEGIGRALALALQQRGARVSVCARSRRDLHPGIAFLACDLTREDERVGLAASLARDGLDVLINNAGIQQQLDFRGSIAFASIEAELAINLLAPLHLCSLLLPLLLAQPEAALVNVTSGLALTPKASAPVYCASKAALRSFSQALRYQLEGSHVSVLEVLPPLVDTAMTRGRGRDKVSPDQVAEAICGALVKGREELRIGKTQLLWALQRVSPALAARTMKNA